MEINTWIEKALKGGWLPTDDDDVGEWRVSGDDFHYNVKKTSNGSIYDSRSIYEILLDPKAWEAVGKVEGWSERTAIVDKVTIHVAGKKEELPLTWQYHMLSMIHALFDGKSIKEYLKTL